MDEKIVKPISGAPTPIPVVQDATPPSVEMNVEVAPKPEEAPQDITSQLPQGDYRTSPLFYEIAAYFAVEPKEYDEAKDRLSVLTDFIAKRTGSTKAEDILIGLRRLEEEARPPEFGQRRYKHLYNYVRLLSRRDSIDKAVSAYKRGY